MRAHLVPASMWSPSPRRDPIQGAPHPFLLFEYAKHGAGDPNEQLPVSVVCLQVGVNAGDEIANGLEDTPAGSSQTTALVLLG